MEKTCNECGKSYPATAEYFLRHKGCKNGLRPLCRPCEDIKQAAYREKNREKRAAYSREWARRNPERVQKRMKDWCRKVRLETLTAYGGENPACACCGEAIEQFLVIDHINGGGSVERKERGAGARFYAWLRSEGFPPGYRVLCHNCNAATSLYGECPHATSPPD